MFKELDTNTHQEPTKPLLRVCEVNGSPSVRFHNVDCMEFMKTIPDKFYDLAIVDPPYGIEIDKHANHGGGKRPIKKYNKIGKNWDNEIPNKKYFDELFRVSKELIIWGANYFLDYLPNTKCMIIWDKMQEFSGSDFELAWTSFSKPSKSYRKSRVEFHNEETKIHPTQKTISMYRWILSNYATTGMKILDTHGGSMSSAIACDMEGFDLDICEIDSEYFKKGVQRFQQYKSQKRLF